MATSDSGRARTFLLAVFVLSGGALVTLFILSRRSPDADRLPFVVPYGWGKVTTQLFLLSGLGLVPARNRPWVLAAGAGLLTVVLLNAALPRPFPIEGELVTATGSVTAVGMANRDLVFRIDSSPLVFRYEGWWPASATLRSAVHPGVQVKVWYDPRSRGRSPEFWRVAVGNRVVAQYAQFEIVRRRNRIMGFVVVAMGAALTTIAVHHAVRQRPASVGTAMETPPPHAPSSI